MPRRKKTDPISRVHRSPEFKAEALKLADSIGVNVATRDLDLKRGQIYAWRRAAKHNEHRGLAEQNLTDGVMRLMRKLVEAREAVAILEMASAYFARNLT